MADGTGWWEVPYGTDEEAIGFVQVRADSKEEAEAKAREMLVDIGVLPGPMHESFKRFVRATSGGPA